MSRMCPLVASCCHLGGAPRPVTALLVFLSALAIVPHSIAAQSAPPGLVEVKESARRGFWMGIGLGAGGESNDALGSGYNDVSYQPTVSFRAGGTVSDRLRLGGEFLSWFDEQGDAVASVSSVLFVAQLYPISSAGLYLKGGLGAGRNALDFDDGFDVGDTGFAGLLGMGYELRVGRRLFLNPTIDLVGQSYSGRTGANYHERLVNFGLGVLFQTRR
jgi:Outer membrane protein beta-barrel domain